MTLAERIKQKRKENGFTLQQVADKSKISRQTVHKYETGIITNIPADRLELLASALKTTPAYLMGWEQDASINSNNLPDDKALTENALDDVLLELLTELSDLTEEERAKVSAFIQGLKANR